ncbi:TPA: YdcF family protein [Candidatus Gracilibacteria bacterium]|nr:YdcF family protein [Candidatus Gracilibacteria bacterium]
MKKFIQTITRNIKNNSKKIILFLLFIFFIPNIYIVLNGYLHLYELNDNEVKYHHFYETDVAIVFGAAAWKNGPSDAFADRLKIAQKLYESRNIKKILISGDNGKLQYNEPETGKKYLIEKGVKSEDIVLDYAGFRTYDTCARASKIWNIKNAYLVTQEFHLSRAIFTCEQFGISAIGVSASTQVYKNHWKNLFRETLAQQKAFYEVLLFKHDPKFLGNIEQL